MNKKNIDAFCYNSESLLDFRMRQNAKKNKCGFPGGMAHARKIFEVCYLLNKLGKTFYTEAVFKNKSKADIYILENRTAIEVLDSEEQKSIEDKKLRYPCPIVQVCIEEEFTPEMIE